MKTKNLMMLKKLLVCVFSITFLTLVNVLGQTNEIKSPDNRLSIKFETIVNKQNNENGGQLVYSVNVQDQPLLIRSVLKLEFENQNPLGEDIKIISTEKSSHDQSYELLSGKTNFVSEQYNELIIHLQENGNTARKLIMKARAYNDAIAFRYEVPKQSNMNDYRLTREKTEFRISKDAISYPQLLPTFDHSYEALYTKIPLSAMAHRAGFVNEALIGLPLLMEVPGVAWLAINEADKKGYSSMYLTNLSKNWAGHYMEALLAPDFDDTSVCVTGSLPLHTPWRILQIGKKPGELIESNILTSLNPENVIEETSWIKPGKAAWNWWAGTIGQNGERDFSTEGMKYYIDFAAKSGLEYLLIDAGWANRGDITKMNGRVDIPALVEYGNNKDVKIWIWMHYDDVVVQMNEAFPIYEEWGIAGLKIDFIERDDQKGIEFYYKAAELAAKHYLMLDFHGSTIPTGLSRTYPNILGYEAVVGMEVSIGSLRDDPDSHVMLPFTRMLQGYMDYTPGGFDNVTMDEFVPRRVKPMVMGTRAHHLAMYVVYESPIQMVSDYPLAYEGEPSFQFIKDVPASWDETNVLNGIPGEFITIARRKGEEWFLGSMTNWSTRQFDIPLDFLDSGTYLAEIYKDADDSGKNPKHIVIEKETVNRDQQLEINLAKAGGCAIRFKPE